MIVSKLCLLDNGILFGAFSSYLVCDSVGIPSTSKVVKFVYLS